MTWLRVVGVAALIAAMAVSVANAGPAREGSGRGSNFAGLRDPYLAYNDCRQLPGMPR